MHVLKKLIRDIGESVNAKDQKTQYERVIVALFDKAQRGSESAMRMILEYMVGKPQFAPAEDIPRETLNDELQRAFNKIYGDGQGVQLPPTAD